MIREICKLIIFITTSSFLLGIVYIKTNPIIQENLKIKKQKMLQEIFPEADIFVEENIRDKQVFSVVKGDEKIGKIVNLKARGYSGEINVLVGLTNKKIRKVKIVSHTETPGLGSKITEEKFLKKFEMSDTKTINDVETITGATISSKAVIEAIKSAILEY